MNSIMKDFKFDFGWRKEESKVLLGKTLQFDVVIDAYTPQDIVTQNQIDTYKSLDIIFEDTMYKVFKEIESYYKSNYDNIKNEISDIEEALKSISLVELIIFDNKLNDRVIGLTFNCDWDIENGIGIKLKNEEIIEIGTQDIVL